MRVLLLGSQQSWMKLYISHVENGFKNRGHEVMIYDLCNLDRFLRIKLSAEFVKERKSRLLERIVKKYKPDFILCIAEWDYDFLRLKTYYNGIVALLDLDGPRRLKENYQLAYGMVDLPLTTSQYMVRDLKQYGILAYYLPMAVNTDYYAPINLTAKEQIKYGRNISYIGRATPYRVDYCKAIEDKGLNLYGKRWIRDKKQHNFSKDVKIFSEVRGKDLVKIYQASKLSIHILQEPLNLYKTLMNLQFFSITSTGRCLIAEYVEEAKDSFDIGKEVLLYSSKEELVEQVNRCLRDVDFAEKIGIAARKRCIAEHTHEHRVIAIEKILDAKKTLS